MNQNNVVEQAPEVEPLPAITVTPLTADEVRNRLMDQFNLFKPHLQAYADYAERIAALSLEYHGLRLSEFLGDSIEVGTLVATLDARETPKSLDTKLAQLREVPDFKIGRVIFDQAKGVYYLFI